jgi:hypothetical protein
MVTIIMHVPRPPRRDWRSNNERENDYESEYKIKRLLDDVQRLMPFMLL